MTRSTNTRQRLLSRTVGGALLAAACSLAVQHTALAQAVPEELLPQELPTQAGPTSASHWGLGLGVGTGRKPYRDFDNNVDALPLLMYENRYISFLGATLDIKLPPAGPVSFRLRARYSNDGYKAKDSPFLAGMAERKGGIWLGGAAIWKADATTLSAEAMTLTGDPEGSRVKLEVNHGFKSGSFTLTPRIAANWYDKKYVDYYYGVRANEVRAGRGFYQGDSAVNAELGVRLGYAIGQHHNVFVDVGVTSLGSGIKDSPLVDRSNESSVKLGYLYAF